MSQTQEIKKYFHSNYPSNIKLIETTKDWFNLPSFKEALYTKQLLPITDFAKYFRNTALDGIVAYTQSGCYLEALAHLDYKMEIASEVFHEDHERGLVHGFLFNRRGIIE